MNKLGTNPSQSRAGEVNGHECDACDSAPAAPIAAAQELTSLFLVLTRQLLAVDDRAADLPLRQLRLCMLLYDRPQAMSALSRELGVPQSAMTQIADRLGVRRLVRRSFEGTDRRVRSLQLTPRGQKMMQLREAVRVARAAAVIAGCRPPKVARCCRRCEICCRLVAR